MRKIPEFFKKNGLDHRLLKRSGRIALYEQSNQSMVYGFEVHLIRCAKAVTGKFVNPDGTVRVVNWPKREILANNEDFGEYGWSYIKLENANKHYKHLIKNEERSKIL